MKQEPAFAGADLGNLVLNHEEVAELDYQARACKRSCRVVVVRKNISKLKGEPTNPAWRRGAAERGSRSGQ